MSPTATERHRRGGKAESPAPHGTPSVNPSFVRRRRLIRRLLASPSAPLVTLIAPAGFSKTTSLAEWSLADRRPFAWITATDRHDDPALLVASIIDALDPVEPVDPVVTAALRSPKPDVSGVVVPRLADVMRDRAPFVFVVDDTQKLASPEAFEVLAAMIDSMPGGAQLALASRTEPPLPLGRMRSQRRLVEFTSRELAMTRDEGAELLANLGLELTPAQLQAIVERTEGWPAALYLAGLALSDQRDTSAAVASFAGDDRIVVDYLRDEFLAATPPDRLSFLIRTSILDQLSGPLCDAVLEQSGSAKVLRDLARSNALVVSLDRTDTRYRYHQLFAEELQAELRLREPEAEHGLHARASRWYADHADADRAIDHAIAAGEVERAGELIWLSYPEVSGRGRLATLDRWLDQLGEDRVAACAPLALSAAHRCLVLGEGDRAAHWARAAGASSADGSDIEADLHLLAATFAGSGVVQMGEDAARASELFAGEEPWQAPCFLYRGVSSHLTGHPDRARPLLQEAARRGAVVSPIIQVLALSQLCLIAVEDGDRDTGSRVIAQASAQVSRCGLTNYPSMLMVSAASAMLHATNGQVSQAQDDLARSTQLLSLITDMPAWYEAQARLVLAPVLLRVDEPGSARGVLRDAARFLELAPDAAVLRDWLSRATAEQESASTENRAREWTLTKAELRTLQYLPGHLSFREIGERVHVSPNTVKSQAQAIYRKLEASSRTEAVDRAREAGLLGDDPLAGE